MFLKEGSKEICKLVPLTTLKKVKRVSLSFVLLGEITQVNSKNLGKPQAHTLGLQSFGNNLTKIKFRETQNLSRKTRNLLLV